MDGSKQVPEKERWLELAKMRVSEKKSFWYDSDTSYASARVDVEST